MEIITAIKGFKDILPADAPLWRKVEDCAREVARRYDFSELRPPIVERTELFARGIGEVTDIVEKEMYTITDKLGEKITLRPEATAGMVRALLEHNLNEGARPTKLWCLGPMFRYENPQKGRQRQFHQLDVEAFGDLGPHIDAEVLLFLTTFLADLGLKDLSININSLGCPQCRPQFREKLISFLSAKKADLCPDCQRRLNVNPLRVIDCKNEKCRTLVKDAPKLLEMLCPDCDEHFTGLKNILEGLGQDFVINPFLVRGLDYYTRTAFEVLSGDLGAQNAVAGGGRYDGLCQTLGGADIPGIGFAVGLERLIMILKEKGVAVSDDKPDYYLAVLTPAALTPAFKLAAALRQRGLKVAADWEAGSLKSRMKRADKAGAAKIIMLGENELAEGLALVRDLVTKEQKSLPLAQPELF